MTVDAAMAPLTPPDCDLQDFPFMPLEVARLRDSELASDETPESCWAALLLWCASWHQLPAASIPDNDQWVAKTCGYVFKGKIDKSWADVRAGAMRGWVKCSDGRFYHPVVAEKARDAWLAKLKQRWSTECGRIKKHNERHEGANVPKPSFEEWVAGGCITGQPLFVPSDKPPVPQGSRRESPSNRQREGQGEGEREGQGEGDIHSAPVGAGGEPALVPAAGELWPNNTPVPPAPPPPPRDPAKTPKERTAEEQERAELWRDVKLLLVEQETAKTVKEAGDMVGKQAAKYGRDVFVVAVRETVRLKPANAFTYLVNLCEIAAGKRIPLGPRGAISDEQRAAAGEASNAEAERLLGFRADAANDGRVIDAAP